MVIEMEDSYRMSVALNCPRRKDKRAYFVRLRTKGPGGDQGQSRTSDHSFVFYCDISLFEDPVLVVSTYNKSLVAR